MAWWPGRRVLLLMRVALGTNLGVHLIRLNSKEQVIKLEL